MKSKLKFLLLLIIAINVSCATKIQEPNTFATEQEVRAALRTQDEGKTEKAEEGEKAEEAEEGESEKVARETIIEYKEKIVEVPPQNFVIDNIGETATTVKDKSKLLKKNNSNSTIGLSEGNFNHAEILYPYRNGIIYPIHTATKKITLIELELGEVLLSYLVGDTLSWKLENEVINNTTQIYVMPLNKNIATNFIVNTDRRKYILNLIENCNYMPVVKWGYGLNLDKKPSISNNSSSFSIPTNQNSNNENVQNTNSGYIKSPDLVMLDRLGSIYWDYDVKYRSHRNFKPKWFPGKVFDDGSRTYIHIPNLDQTPIRPAIFATDKRGKVFKILNYRITGKYYIVDSVEEKLVLTTEKDNKHENVYIERNS